MAVQPKTKITDTDLLALGEDVRAEVIDGELVIQMSPNLKDHAFYVQRLGTYFDNFVSARKLGTVFGDNALYKLEETLEGGIRGARVPDLSFVSYERLPADAPMDEIPLLAPDIAVEVISESESYSDALLKMNYYLDHGVRIVIHILPRLKQVHTFTAPNRTPTVLTVDDTLTCGDVLPGFAIPVAALFDRGSDLHGKVLKSLLGE